MDGSAEIFDFFAKDQGPGVDFIGDARETGMEFSAGDKLGLRWRFGPEDFFCQGGDVQDGGGWQEPVFDSAGWWDRKLKYHKLLFRAPP